MSLSSSWLHCVQRRCPHLKPRCTTTEAGFRSLILDPSGSSENVKDCVFPKPRDIVFPTYDLTILTILCVLQYSEYPCLYRHPGGSFSYSVCDLHIVAMIYL